MRQTNTYTNLHNKEWHGGLPIGLKENEIYVWHQTVPSRNNGDGRYYTRQYWQAETPDKKYHGMRAQIAAFIHIPEKARRNTNLSTAQ